MKKIEKIFLVILVIPVIGITIISAPWLLMLGVSFLEPNPPKPAITYGEFPFSVEYRIGDEIFVVNDVVICEYDGIGWNEGIGKHYKWRQKLKNSTGENVLIIEDGELCIYINVGGADYYMNDPNYMGAIPFIPNIYPVGESNYRSQDEIMDKYKIELINYEFSKPIENKFEYFLIHHFT